MIHDITTPQIREVEVKEGEILTCDICNDRIKVWHFDRPMQVNRKAVNYYKIMTGHHDWGNDSCDSFEHYDVCTKCLSKVFEDYISRAESKGRQNTEFIEIEHCYGYSEEEED